MGYTSAYDMALRTDLESAVRWHLRANCYPPVPLVMTDASVRAVRFVAQGRGERNVTLPEGVTHKQRGGKVQAVELVRMLRLEAFVNAVATDGGEA